MFFSLGMQPQLLAAIRPASFSARVVYLPHLYIHFLGTTTTAWVAFQEQARVLNITVRLYPFRSDLSLCRAI